jgi:hypothetical protein
MSPTSRALLPLLLVGLTHCQRAVEPSAASETPAARAQRAVTERIASDALSALSQGSRAAVERAPLPVLLFGDAATSAASVVTAGPEWYAISARVGERTLSLHVVRDASNGAAPQGHGERVRGAPAMVLFNEGVRSVTWSEAGATYALEVECFHPFEDRACTQSTYVLGLAESLVRVRNRLENSTVNGAQSAVGGAR